MHQRINPRHFFWSIIENELGTKINSHLKNSFVYDSICTLLYFIVISRLLHATIFPSINSLCGFNNAAVFQTIKLNDVDFVEQYMRNKLAVRLENANFQEKIHFFGNFANNPTEFIFNRGERSFINQIVSHIKEVAKSSDGLSRFKENVSDSADCKFTEKFSHLVCQTSIGLAFCKLPSIIDQTSPTIGFKLQDNEHSADQNEYIDITELGLEFKTDNQMANDVSANSTQQFENESTFASDSLCVRDHCDVQSEHVSSVDDEFSMLIENYRDVMYTQLYEQKIRLKLCVSLHAETSKDFFVNVQKGSVHHSFRYVK